MTSLMFALMLMQGSFEPMLYQETNSQRGRELFRVVNKWNAPMRCIVYSHGRTLFEFYINPKSKSDWFDKPGRSWGWNCQMSMRARR